MVSVLQIYIEGFLVLILALIPSVIVAEFLNKVYGEKISMKFRMLVFFLGVLSVELVYDLEITYLPLVNEVISIQAVGVERYTFIFMSWVALIEEGIKFLFITILLLLSKISFRKISNEVDSKEKYAIDFKGYRLSITEMRHIVYSTLCIGAVFGGVEHWYHMLRVNDNALALSILVARTQNGTQNVHLMTGLLFLTVLQIYRLHKNKVLGLLSMAIAFSVSWWIHVTYNTWVFTALYGLRPVSQAVDFIWMCFILYTSLFLFLNDQTVISHLKSKFLPLNLPPTQK